MSNDVQTRAETHRGSRRGLALGFGLLVGLTFGLIVLGALVRAHGAGLACPDWPLCFGQAVPQFDLRVAFEWSHRAVAGSVALFFAGLSIAALRVDRSDALRRLIGLAAVLLAIQIVLGALTVWLKLASWTVTAHLITGNSFALTCFWIALALRDERDPLRVASRGARIWTSISAGLLLAQFALGGLVSSEYAAMACPEWPTCNGGVFFPTWRGNVGLHLMHRTNGYLLIASFAVTAWVCRREPRVRRAAALLLALGVAQVGVGIANVLTGVPVEVTGLHSAFAAAIALTTGFAMRAAWTGRDRPLPS